MRLADSNCQKLADTNCQKKKKKSKIEQKKGNGKDMNRCIKLKRRKSNQTNEIKSFL